MTFKEYKYTGERDVINKTLTHVADITGYFKDDTELINPVLILKPGYSVTTSNYFFIDGRYYFVNGVTFSQQRLLVQLELDELETYKSSILNEYAVIGRSYNQFNIYQTDHDMPMRNDSDITVKSVDLAGKTGRILSSRSDAIGFLYRDEDSNTILSFNTNDKFVECGARPAHLRNKDIVLGKMQEDGTIRYDWSVIYPSLAK